MANPAALSRPNSFEIDIDAITHNTRQMREAIGPSRQMFVAVKGDAYGFGVDAVANATLSAGADALAMVSIGDAVRLRQRGIQVPILIYPGNLPNDDVISAVSAYSLIPTVTTIDEARSFSGASPLRVFVKVDVADERNGVAVDEGPQLIAEMLALSNIEVGGVYTHFHLGDEAPLTYLQWLFERFTTMLTSLQRAGIHVPVRMAASTRVMRMSLDMLLNAVDLGQIIYGMEPAGESIVQFDLRPAFVALKSRLITVKPMRRTEFPEQAPFPLSGVTRIGVFPLGAIDGIGSLTSTHVLVGGERARLLGAPSLEHYRVDLTLVPSAAVGDEVVVIGRQAANEITMQEVMAYQSIPREVRLITKIASSIPRTYLGGAAST